MTDALRIRKREHPVVVRLASGTRLEGAMFLAERARHRHTPERPFDVLVDDAPFFPLAHADGGRLLLRKQSVMLVETAPPEDDLELAVATVIAVEVTLLDGSTVRGQVSLEAPVSRPRLLDFLNGYTPAFLRVTTDEQEVLINVSAVVSFRADD